MNDDDKGIDAPAQPLAVRGPTPKAVRIIAELRRRGITAEAIACCAGVSHNTVRFLLRTGLMPERQHAVEALERFAKANHNAETRIDLRFT